MIVTQDFMNYMQELVSNNKIDAQKSVYNWTMYVVTGMSISDRISVAFEILMGRKFCLWVSKGDTAHDPNVELFDIDNFNK